MNSLVETRRQDQPGWELRYNRIFQPRREGHIFKPNHPEYITRVIPFIF